MTTEIREIYVSIFSGMQQVQGTDPVAATSKEQAIEILQEKYKSLIDFKILDIFKLKDCPEALDAMKKKDTIIKP